MADLNANLILQGTSQALGAEPQAAQDVQGQMQNAQKFSMNAMQLKEEAQELSDSQKLSSALTSVTAPPNDPTYNDQVIKAARDKGVSGKALLGLQQNLLKSEKSQLDVQAAAMNLADTHMKLNADAQAAQDKEVSRFLTNAGSVLANYKDSKAKGVSDSTLNAMTSTQIQQIFADEQNDIQQKVQSGQISPQQGADTLKQIGQLQQSMFPGGNFSVDALQRTYEVTGQAKQEYDTRKAKAAAQTEEVKASGAAEEQKLDLAKKRQDLATAGKETKEIQVTRPDGSTETHIGIVDKATGKITDTGQVAAPKSTGNSATTKRFVTKVVNDGKDATDALNSIAKLNSSSGIFGTGGDRSLPAGLDHVIGDAGANSVKKLMTGEQQKRYNAQMAGLAPIIATAENLGNVPSDAQIHSIEKGLTIDPTDSAQTAQYKVAIGARRMRNALEAARDLATPEQQKSIDAQIVKLNAFPDPDTIDAGKPGDNLFPDRNKTGQSKSQVINFGDLK